MTGVDDPPPARALRQELVERVGLRTGAPTTILDVLARTPRHLFMPSDVSLETAYRDGPYPIGHGQTISQPTVVVMMTEALRLDGSQRVLEVGTGSGYQTAILAPLCQHVFTIEAIGPLSVRAAEILDALGIENVSLRVGDGYEGWREEAPFDRIVLTAAPPEPPSTLLDQLAPDGMLVGPIGERFSQRLIRIERDGQRFRETFLGDVAFVPMVRQR